MSQSRPFVSLIVCVKVELQGHRDRQRDRQRHQPSAHSTLPLSDSSEKQRHGRHVKRTENRMLLEDCWLAADGGLTSRVGGCVLASRSTSSGSLALSESCFLASTSESGTSCIGTDLYSELLQLQGR